MDSVQVKVWLGWLDSSLVENLEETTDEAPDVAFKDTRGQSGFLPLGASLQALARDKFGITTGEPHESIDARVGQLELGIVDIKETLGEKLVKKAEPEPVFETADEVGPRSSSCTTQSSSSWTPRLTCLACMSRWCARGITS